MCCFLSSKLAVISAVKEFCMQAQGRRFDPLALRSLFLLFFLPTNMHECCVCLDYALGMIQINETVFMCSVCSSEGVVRIPTNVAVLKRKSSSRALFSAHRARRHRDGTCTAGPSRWTRCRAWCTSCMSHGRCGDQTSPRDRSRQGRAL